jgi:O-antigen ligase
MSTDDRVTQRSFNWAEGLLILGLASCLIVWGGPTYWALAFAALGVLGCLQDRTACALVFSQPLLRALVLTFTVHVVVSAALFGVHGNRFNPEVLAPFVLFPWLAVAVWRARLSATGFWWGVALGGLGAGAIASHQHFVQGIGRAHGFMNAIPFGGLSVVFALAACIGASSADLRRREHPALLWALVAAAAAASYASLLSSSKGGWLSLATVIALGAVRVLQSLRGPRRFGAAWTIAGALVIASYLAPSHVFDRVQSGWAGGVTWLQTGAITEGSVSYRLEMWSLGLRLFQEHPIVGADRATWLAKKEAYIAAGEFSPRLRSQETMDSEWVGVLAGGGLVGLLASLMLILVPAWAFKRAADQSRGMARDLALLGMWMSVVYAEFGLSISLWGVSAFRQFYVSWLVLIAALIINTQDQEAQAQRADLT